MRLRTALAVVGAAGSAPHVTGGLAVAAGVRWRWLSAVLEGRVDLPASAAAAAGGSVSGTLFSLTVAPCFHLGAGSSRARWAPRERSAARARVCPSRGREDVSTSFGAAGVRLGGEVPLEGDPLWDLAASADPRDALAAHQPPASGGEDVCGPPRRWWARSGGSAWSDRAFFRDGTGGLPPNTRGVLAPSVTLPRGVTRPVPAFRALFEAEFDYVFHSLFRLGVRSADLEDLTHEVFVAVHRALADYDPARPPLPARRLFGIAFRVASDHRRRAHHRRGAPDDRAGDAPDARPLADEQLAAEEARLLLLAGLDALPIERRAVVVMHDLDGCSAPRSPARSASP